MSKKRSDAASSFNFAPRQAILTCRTSVVGRAQVSFLDRSETNLQYLRSSKRILYLILVLLLMR